MFSSVIVYKAAGQQVPEQYLKKVLDLNKSCYAYASADKENGVVALCNEPAEATLENIMELQFENKAEDLCMQFGNSQGQPVQPEDLQPFVLISDDGSPVLVAFLEGDFTGHHKTGSSHTNEYHFVNNFLLDQIGNIYEKADSDLAKTVSFFEDEKNQPQFTNEFGERGMLLLLSSTGDMQAVAKGNDARQFDWGFTSNGYGMFDGEYPVKEPEVPVSEPAKAAKPNKFANKKLSETAPSSPLPQQKTAVPVTPPKTDTAVGNVVTLKPGTEVWGRAPEGLTKKEDRKHFFNKFAFKWDDVKQSYLNKQTIFQIKPEMADQFVQRLGVICDKPGATPATTVAKEPTKTTTEPVKATGSTVREPTQVLDVDELKWMKDSFLKSLDSNELIVQSPEKLPETEGKYSSFTNDLGIAGLQNTIGWKYTRFFSLAENCPKAAANLLMQFRMEWAKLHSEVEVLRLKQEAPKVTDTAPRAKTMSLGKKAG